MKVCGYIFCIVFLLATGVAHAGAIKKCIDATGKTTYTDKGCGAKTKAENTYLGTITANNNPNNNTVTEQYRVSEIGYLTTETQTRCEQEATKQFKGRFSKTRIKPVVEFTEIVDRTIVWDEVNIVLKGVFTVDNKPVSTTIDFQCSTHKRKSGGDWDVEIKELASNNP